MAVSTSYIVEESHWCYERAKMCFTHNMSFAPPHSCLGTSTYCCREAPVRIRALIRDYRTHHPSLSQAEIRDIDRAEELLTYATHCELMPGF
jgi:hypothetical protein